MFQMSLEEKFKEVGQVQEVISECLESLSEQRQSFVDDFNKLQAPNPIADVALYLIRKLVVHLETFNNIFAYETEDELERIADDDLHIANELLKDLRPFASPDAIRLAQMEDAELGSLRSVETEMDKHLYESLTNQLVDVSQNDEN